MVVTDQDKKVHISVLDFPLLNSKNTRDTITGKLISDLVLQVYCMYRKWKVNKLGKGN